jgi:hypothetical protein
MMTNDYARSRQGRRRNFEMFQGPMIGGGGGLKCLQVWTITLEQRLHTARTRKKVFAVLQKASIPVMPLLRLFRQESTSEAATTVTMIAGITMRSHDWRGTVSICASEASLAG